MTDRHREKPLSVRLGLQRQRLEDYARDTNQAVRRVIADAVTHWLDRHVRPETEEDVPALPRPAHRPNCKCLTCKPATPVETGEQE